MRTLAKMLIGSAALAALAILIVGAVAFGQEAPGLVPTAQQQSTPEALIPADPGGLSGFIAANKAKIEAALMWGLDEKARVFAGLPLRYWGDYRSQNQRDYAKVSLGAAWTRTGGSWGSPQLAIPFAIDLLEVGREFWGFAGPFTRRASWTDDWKIWTSATFLPPTNRPLASSSWVSGRLFGVGIGLEARIGK